MTETICGPQSLRSLLSGLDRKLVTPGFRDGPYCMTTWFLRIRYPLAPNTSEHIDRRCSFTVQTSN